MCSPNDAVREVLLAERAAKDLGQWTTMCAAFAAGSFVRVSWFRGSGAEFTAAAKARAVAGGSASFHEIGAVAVTVRGDRATAHATCTVHLRGDVGVAQDLVTVDIASRVRLHWQVGRYDWRWLIERLDAIYLRDTIAAADPSQPLPAAVVGLGREHRPSYPYVSMMLAARGYQIDPDLPGLDRPDLVVQLLDGQQRWLEGR